MMDGDRDWLDYPKNEPSKGDCVAAIIKHWYTNGTRAVELRFVDEDDVDFRFIDDGSELSYDWSVMKFSYVVN